MSVPCANRGADAEDERAAVRITVQWIRKVVTVKLIGRIPGSRGQDIVYSNEFL